jgi:hypothetical protein
MTKRPKTDDSGEPVERFEDMATAEQNPTESKRLRLARVDAVRVEAPNAVDELLIAYLLDVDVKA